MPILTTTQRRVAHFRTIGLAKHCPKRILVRPRTPPELIRPVVKSEKRDQADHCAGRLSHILQQRPMLFVHIITYHTSGRSLWSRHSINRHLRRMKIAPSTDHGSPIISQDLPLLPPTTVLSATSLATTLCLPCQSRTSPNITLTSSLSFHCLSSNHVPAEYLIRT